MRPLCQFAASAATCTLLAATPAAADGLSYHGSLGVFNGDYTLSEETTSVVLLNGIAWLQGRWRVAVDLPLIYQDTPYVSYAGGIPVPTGRRWSQSQGLAAVSASSQTGSQSGASNGTQAGDPNGTLGQGRQEQGGKVLVPDPDTVEFDETGVGDPLMRVDLRLGGSDRTRFGLFGGVKAPIVDVDDGFGTGEWDFGGGVTFGAAAGRGRIFGELGYWVYGDLDLYELDDPMVATVGYGASFDERWSWLASLYAATASFDEVDGPAEASVAFQRAFDGGRFLSLTLGVGLTETAPDVRLTLGWSSSL
jgi:hypothetical protein